VPWIGTDVIITKVGSPLKGYTGVVKDVLRGQDTASGLKIAIQLTRLDPTCPFMQIVVDYDHVAERRSVENLHLHYISQYLICLQALDFHFRTLHSPKAFPFGLQRAI
jgi:hypothetical protein